MKLSSFKIQNFRSIQDSGRINVSDLTSLVGRNESGKSNLLLALASLNPPGNRQPLNPVKDFPRSRRLEECKNNTVVVWTWWDLAPDETEELASLLGPVKKVAIGRGYGAENVWTDFETKPPELDSKRTTSALKRLKPVLEPRWDALEGEHKTHAAGAWAALETANANTESKAWAAAITPAAAAVRKHLGAASIMLDDKQDELLTEIEDHAKHIASYDANKLAAHKLVLQWLPQFIYIADFPELYGHQELSSFVERRGQNPATKEREDNFEKLAKVAGFKPQELYEKRNDHELRGQILNRASSLVTGEIRRLWKDRQLMVRVDIDGPNVTVLVSDPNAQYPVEVNLDERSRGFRWFFAFYITFSADTQGGNADGAILLLDEPGLYLHAKSQEHLLKHFREDYKNQIIYTTHSPFMVPPDALAIVRTVNIDEKTGTKVSNVPTGDSRTLFPLQAALGYQLSQTLFVGHSNLIVEGVTDFWILSSVNAHFAATGFPALPEELTITPAGGAGKVTYMAALLASEDLKVLVLLDDDRAGRETQKDIVTNKLLRDTAVLFVTDAFDPKPTEADIEDLIDPAIYDTLVTDTYKAELKGKKLMLNAKIPRIVKRYEEAFKALGLEFYKTRPAREFMSLVGSAPSKALSADSVKRFGTIFKELSVRYEKMKNVESFK
ncbi:AAA family ATPase [Bradyrhizobium brasilense]|uniref:AAA family ATPase n=1 Tax=Bradyrhizobium brasilense TaxID=1419277 RepID=UPI002877330E|nr:AAA family ATPase [Bradyrhizobium brasilense]MCP3412727.1 AAA family ATPase [Bradyrhizobium brasilense]